MLRSKTLEFRSHLSRNGYARPITVSPTNAFDRLKSSGRAPIIDLVQAIILAAVPVRPTMPAFITFGRVLFAVLFIVSGAFKLLDIAATTQMITDRVVIPGLLTPYTTQLEGMTGMPMAQMLAIAAGATELICGLLI